MAAMCDASKPEPHPVKLSEGCLGRKDILVVHSLHHLSLYAASIHNMYYISLDGDILFGRGVDTLTEQVPKLQE